MLNIPTVADRIKCYSLNDLNTFKYIKNIKKRQ